MKNKILFRLISAMFTAGLMFVQAGTNQAAPGDLDLTFGGGGTLISESGYNEGAKAVAVQPDGKIVVAANKRIIKYSADGVIEQIFGTYIETYTGIATEPDGKIVTVGNYSHSLGCGAYGIAVRRFNADGTLDATFGITGSGYTLYSSGCGTLGYRAYGNSIAIQDNGKIVVGGKVALGGDYDFLALRLNADGSFDTGFNADGIGIYSFGNYNDEALAVAVQKLTGKIVLAGFSKNLPSSNPPYEYAALAMLQSNGYYDVNFGNFGRVSTDLGGFSENKFYSVAFQSKSRIVAGGFAGHDAVNAYRVVALYSINGSLDANFDGDGLFSVQIPTKSPFVSVLVQPSGKILAGSSFGASTGFYVYRFNLDGSKDTTFGGGGVQVVDFPGNSEQLTSMAIQPDGKIILAGSVYDSGEGGLDIGLARLLP